MKEIPPVDAWVVSNDSYRNRLDSFEFSLDALAEQSVFHLISSGVTLYKKTILGSFRGMWWKNKPFSWNYIFVCYIYKRAT